MKATDLNKRGTALSMLLAVIFLAGIVMIVINAFTAPSQTMSHISNIQAGMDAYVKKDSLVAVDQSAFVEMMHAAAAQNEAVTKQMLLNGSLWIVSHGTKVHVLNRTANGTQVEILDGQYRGRTGYMIPDFLE